MPDHTSGPWTVREETVGNRVVHRLIYAPEDSGHGHKPIATLHAGFTCFKADARLIAAAPDLLESCEALLGLFDDEPLPCGMEPDARVHRATEQARIAIAKAKGEIG